MLKKFGTALALMGAVVTHSAANSAIVVDQSQLLFNQGAPFEFNFPSFSLRNYPIGQSFTAGRNGALAGITVYCNGACDLNGLPSTLTLQIHSGATIGGTLLGATSLTSAGVTSPNGGLLALRFNTGGLGINVAAGTQYNFAITQVTGPGDLANRGILLHNGNPYAGGTVLDTPGYGAQPNWDLTFFTEVGRVPEPASWAMMIGGFALTGAALRRRRSAVTA